MDSIRNFRFREGAFYRSFAVFYLLGENMKELIFATHNQHKANEIQAILRAMGMGG